MNRFFSNWQLRTKVLVAAATAIALGFSLMIAVIANGVCLLYTSPSPRD